MATAAILSLLAVSTATSIAGGVIAKRNADSEAKTLKKVGQLELDDRRREMRRLLAAQTVAFAKGGVSPGSGSPLDVLGDTVAEADLSALRVRYSRQAQAKSVTQQGDLALLGGIGSAFGNLTSVAAASQDTFLTRRQSTSTSKLNSTDF